MKSLQTLALLIAFITVNASAVTVIKESRTDEDIKFVTSPGGVPTEQGQIDGATGNLGFDDITNAAGSGAPNFPFGATGISASITDFTIQSIADPTLTLNGGVIRRGDGREILTYDGTGATSGDFGGDITANLDTVLGSAPSDATTYYLYISLGSLTETILTDNNRSVFGVTEDNLVLSTSKPTDQGTAGFLYLATITSATTGNSWSGAGSSFVSAGTKSYQTPNVNVSPTVYQLAKQSIGHPGIINNSQVAVSLDDISAADSNVAGFNLSGDASKTFGTATASLTVGTGVFNKSGFYARDDVLYGDGTTNVSSTDAHFLPESTDWSFAIWVNFDSWTSSTGGSNVLGNSSGTNGTRGTDLTLGADGSLSLRVSENGGSSITESLITVPLGFENGTWHHVAATYDFSATTLKLFVDGNLLVSSTTVTDTNAHTTFLIGDPSGGFEAPGAWQDFVFVNGDLLTDSEVLGIYSRRFEGQQIKAGHVLTDDSITNPGTDTSYWNLNDLNDDSSNARPLVNEGSVTFDGRDILGGTTAAVFNGTAAGTLSYTADDFMNKGDADFTVAAWVAADNWVGNQTFFATSPSSGDRVLEFLLSGASNRTLFVVFTTVSTTDTIEFNPSPLPAPGSYHHIALTYDSEPRLATVYYDGVPVNFVTLGDALKVGGSNEFNLGTRRNQADSFFSGRIDEFIWSQRLFSSDEIKRLYSAKITHSKSVLPDNQQWYGTFFKGDNSTFSNELDQDFLLDKKSNLAFIETGLSPEDSVVLRLQNQSQNTTTVVADTFTTGLLSSDPGPVAHGLACNIPSDYYVLLEGATTAGDFDKRYDLCTAKTDGTIACTLPTVDATHRVIIEASCAPIGTSVDVATNPQMLIQRNQSTSDVLVPVDHSLYRPDVEIQAAHTYTINGKWNSVGEITGAGTLNGSGSVVSLDAGQNGDDVTFDGDVTVAGKFIGGAEFVAQVRYLPTASCSWARTSTSLGTFPPDTDCASPVAEVVGSQYIVDTTDDNLPTAKITNAKPGIYVVTATFNVDYGAGNLSASYGITDGTNTRGIIGEFVGTSLADVGRPTHTCVGTFAYSDTGTRTFEMVASSSSSSVFIEGVAPNRTLTFTIMRYPL